MGPCDHVSREDARNKHISLGLRAFPSPAESNVSLDSPTLIKTLAGASPGLWTPRAGFLENSPAVPTEPGAAKEVAVMTPPADQNRDQLDPMSRIVGGVLAPVPVSLPRRPSVKAGPGFRLPSFEALGIAAPHPDRYGYARADSAPPGLTRESFGAVTRPQSIFDSFEPSPSLTSTLLEQHHCTGIEPPRLGRAINSPVHQYVHTLTPPAETGEPSWRPSLACVMSSGAMDSPDTDSGFTQEPTGTGGHLSEGASATTSSDPSNAPIVVPITAPVITGDRQWVDGAVQTVLTNLRTATTSTGLIKVLSHALPSPSPTGHTFPCIIEAIHNSTPTSPTAWINVFHAIPGRFNLEELPTSPPNTPGPPIGGDDYFTQKIFDSAVRITDYQQELSLLPRSPRPIVPPSSIDVSIVERYIPPSSSREFQDMFDINGPSILIDRLVELSPNNGSLVFIYPTKTGATTFMHEYLSPILDPILRSMVVTNGFSSDLSLSLGAMPAAELLLEHSDLERRTKSLCTRLTQRSSQMERFHGRRARFELVYSQTQKVELSRQAWANDWWTRQEKVHVTEVVTKAAHEAQTKSSNRHIERPPTVTELWQKLMKDVGTRPYDANQEPQNGVEVAVFVIKRSE